MAELRCGYCWAPLGRAYYEYPTGSGVGYCDKGHAKRAQDGERLPEPGRLRAVDEQLQIGES